MARFDDNFLTVLRNVIQEQADAAGLLVQIEDAQDDVAKQLDQINNFIASSVDAIIVNPVDTSAPQAMSDAAAAAGVPLVYVNRQPINVDTLPDNQAFVALNESDSSRQGFIEQCNQWAAAGKTEVSVYVLQGQLSNQATMQRAQNYYDVMEAGECKVKVNVIDQQTANWSRDEAQNLMTNWLSTGAAFDGILDNNDEMALGAIQAMKAAGIDMASVIVSGDLDITVFQNAAAQGGGALGAAVKLAAGEAVEQKVFIPFELVTPANIGGYLSKN